MTINATKDKARTLINTLRDMDIRLTHHRALEVLAKMEGAKGWNEYAATAVSAQAATPALTEGQQAVLDKVTRESIEAYGPNLNGRAVKVFVAVDREGNIVYNLGVDMGKHPKTYLEVGLIIAYDHECRLARKPLPEVPYFLTVTLRGESGKCVVQDSAFINFAEACNWTIDLELMRNCCSISMGCPLTGVAHQVQIGVLPFFNKLPVWEDAVPPRVWEQANEMSRVEETDERRIVRVTVGEMRAALIKAASPR